MFTYCIERRDGDKPPLMLIPAATMWKPLPSNVNQTPQLLPFHVPGARLSRGWWGSGVWGSPELASIQCHRSEIRVETLAGVFFQAASRGNKKESPAGGRIGGPQEHACYILSQLGSLRAREVGRALNPRVSPIWNVINEPRMRETLTK